MLRVFPAPKVSEPLLIWNVFWLIINGLDARLSGREQWVGLLGFVLNLKLLWAIGLLAFLMRDHKANRKSVIG